MDCLSTRWGKSLDKENILKEYPRPNLVRNSLINLNGEWDYAITKKKEVKEYDGKILVPYSVESSVSGVEKTVTEKDRIWYRRKFTLNEDFKPYPFGIDTASVILKLHSVDNQLLITVHKLAFKGGAGDVFVYFSVVIFALSRNC